MKDYYQILGLPQNCSQADIKKTFRKLAFQYHPDTNAGDKQAEQKFKELYEAYGVLGDQEKRRQYDRARMSPFAGAGYNPGFAYSQQDIFRTTFSNQSTVDEMSRMFSQAGLRFDPEFLNRVFFAGNGVVFQFFNNASGSSGPYTGAAGAQSQPRTPVYKQGLIDRWLTRVATKVGKFILSSLLGLQHASSAGQGLDHHADFEVSVAEAAAGDEKELIYSRNGELKKLMVKLPVGVKAGTKIRLRGMGRTGGGRVGDLYLNVKIKE